MSIAEETRRILASLPEHVTLVAAAKTRTPQEVAAAIEGGITDVAHNYVQEAGQMVSEIGVKARWHLIGRLQKNKAKKAVQIFDMIQTIDSVRIAEAVNKHCSVTGKVMPVLVEINSGREPQKSGVLPEEADDLVKDLGRLSSIRVEGLMTMGPMVGNPENARPYFRTTREVFERLTEARMPNVDMKYLSMGMSNSYKVAIEEGSNMVRIGTDLFGTRD